MASLIDALQSALAEQQRGDHAAAISLLREVLAIRDDHPDAHHLLGLSLQAQGDPEAALAAIQKAIAINPTEPMFHTNAGAMAVAAGDVDAGIAFYRRALELDPDYADACNNLGIALQQLGYFDEAVVALQRALEINPRMVSAMVNLGNVLHALGRHVDAVEQYRNVIAIAPDLAEAHNNLGNAFKSLRRYDEAIVSYERAVALRPDHSEAYYNRGIALATRGDVDGSADSFARAIAILPDPRYRLSDAGLLPVLPRGAAEIDQWRRRFIAGIAELYAEGITLDGMPSGAPVMDFYLAYHGENDRDIMILLARLFRRLYPELRWSTPHSFAPPARDGGRRIRLGIFSSHLRNHAVAWTIRGLLEGLPKDRFEIAAYGPRSTEGPMMPEINAVADRVVLLANSVARARSVIAEARHDVLIFADIGMEGLSLALAHARLAPVQCVTWGHPVTTGIPTIDYYISSDLAEPEDADAHYSERLIRLGGVQTCYRRPVVPPQSDRTIGLGIPDAATVYLCPQSLFKIHPDMDTCLAQILERDPNGVLVLFEGTDRVITDCLKGRWQLRFGVAMDRVHFLPRTSVDLFLGIVSKADVVLDTWPFGGGNTSYQAFASGKPIVTFPGKFLRGRGTLALYQHMGVLDCVAETPDAYVDVAVRLGTDKDYRAQLSDLIHARSDVLFDDERVVGDLTRFLIEAAA